MICHSWATRCVLWLVNREAAMERARQLAPVLGESWCSVRCLLIPDPRSLCAESPEQSTADRSRAKTGSKPPSPAFASSREKSLDGEVGVDALDAAHGCEGQRALFEQSWRALARDVIHNHPDRARTRRQIHCAANQRAFVRQAHVPVSQIAVGCNLEGTQDRIWWRAAAAQ